MATTTPDAIYSADTSTNLGIAAITGTMATSIQAALTAMRTAGQAIHAEYTWSQPSAANGAFSTLGTLTLDSTTSSTLAASFFTPVAGGLTLIKQGRYMAAYTISMPAGASGRTFLDLAVNGFSARNSLPVPEDGGSSATISRATTAPNQALTGNIWQTTGAVRAVTGRLTIDYFGVL